MEHNVFGTLEAFRGALIALADALGNISTALQEQQPPKTIGRTKTHDDFLNYCRNMGAWEIAELLDRCEVVFWKPEIPRFKFRGPQWECGQLNLTYRQPLTELLTKYFGNKPKYLVFEPIGL